MEEITTTLAAVHGVVVAAATMEDAPTSSSASRMPRSARQREQDAPPYHVVAACR